MRISREALDAFFDEAWFQEADCVVQRYEPRGSLKSRGFASWETVREHGRARTLFFSSQRAVSYRNAVRAAMDPATFKVLIDAPPDFAAKAYRIFRAADANPRFREDLIRLLDHYEMPLDEIVERVFAGGMFAPPVARGRPRGRLGQSKFSRGDQIQYAARAVRKLIRRDVSDRNSAVRSVTEEVYPDGKRLHGMNGPGTPEAFRRAIYPVFDAVLWRLEASRYRRAQEMRSNYSPSTS